MCFLIFGFCILTFYLKGEISQEQNFVKLKQPNTILGLIPLGAKKESLPVNQLSVVESNFKLKFFRLLIGAVVAIMGIIMFPESFLAGLIILLLGANTAITAFETDLIIQTTSGAEKTISFFIFEKSKANLAETQINQLISARMDDTNTRQQTDRIVNAINNK